MTVFIILETSVVENGGERRIIGVYADEKLAQSIVASFDNHWHTYDIERWEIIGS